VQVRRSDGSAECPLWVKLPCRMCREGNEHQVDSNRQTGILLAGIRVWLYAYSV
jgi:hypothetical protein